MEPIRKAVDDTKLSSQIFLSDIKMTYSNYQSDGTMLRKLFGDCRRFFEKSYNNNIHKLDFIPSRESVLKPYGDSFNKFCDTNASIVNFSQVHSTLVIGSVSTLVALPTLYGKFHINIDSCLMYCSIWIPALFVDNGSCSKCDNTSHQSICRAFCSRGNKSHLAIFLRFWHFF
jgi:hypothetical protein